MSEVMRLRRRWRRGAGDAREKKRARPAAVAVIGLIETRARPAAVPGTGTSVVCPLR